MNPHVHLPVSEHSQMELHEICAAKVIVARRKFRIIFPQNNLPPNLIKYGSLIPCNMSFALCLSQASIFQQNLYCHNYKCVLYFCHGIFM